MVPWGHVLWDYTPRVLGEDLTAFYSAEFGPFTLFVTDTRLSAGWRASFSYAAEDECEVEDPSLYATAREAMRAALALLSRALEDGRGVLSSEARS